MVDVKGVQAKQRVQAATSIRLPEDVPFITDEMFDALLQRSGDARELDERIRQKEQSGKLITGADVQEMLGRAYRKDGKPKTECAAVIAYYAQHKPRIFSSDAEKHIVEYVEKVDKSEWNRLVADLEAFVARLAEQRRRAEREEYLKKMRDKDDRDHVQKKMDSQKANGTKAERAAEMKRVREKREAEKREIREASEASLTEEITNGGKLKLSEVEETQLLMLKKGFAKRD